jgi:hypothetical protein
MGGDTALVLGYLVELDPGFLICPAETDQRAFMEALRGKPEIGVRLNMNVSVLMDPDERIAMKEAESVASVALETAIPGRPVLVGTGVLPVDADPARIRRLGEFVSGL